MNEPEELKRAPLPDDLQLLLRELKVPENDPILPLLGWLWTQLNQSTNTIADARMAFMAALDTRLERIGTSTELLTGVSQQMEQTRSAMAAIRTDIGQWIEAELKSPIEVSLASCRAMAVLLDRLLHQTTQVLVHPSQADDRYLGGRIPHRRIDRLMPIFFWLFASLTAVAAIVALSMGYPG